MLPQAFITGSAKIFLTVPGQKWQSFQSNHQPAPVLQSTADTRLFDGVGDTRFAAPAQDKQCDEDMSICTLKSGRRHYVNHLPMPKLLRGHVLGSYGFRRAHDHDPPLTECHCDFGGNPNAGKNRSYRVRR
ncbi:hypothetical protein [Bradyrhizobium sp. OAE829]|uniref:hypothetical protein n=1 Tax=Bradyrhizobium sp. OAE829 TaxID=2663807 RepID=UPI00178ADC47